jgi:hypothetical protein
MPPAPQSMASAYRRPRTSRKSSNYLRTLIGPPHGWKPQTYYIGDCSVGVGNPTWRCIVFSGFLNGPNGDPGSYSCIWSATGGQMPIDESYYLAIVMEIGNIDGPPQITEKA